MEKMLRKKKDNSDYEIDRELTGKFAIEKNAEYQDRIAELEEENKTLKEFKTKREESMFYFKAQMERAEPKTAGEAEDLQRAKEIFEKLYRQELSCLEEENKNLREENKIIMRNADDIAHHNVELMKKVKELEKELEKLKSNYVYDAKQVRDVC